jgi:hypothetical protein
VVVVNVGVGVLAMVVVVMAVGLLKMVVQIVDVRERRSAVAARTAVVRCVVAS